MKNSYLKNSLILGILMLIMPGCLDIWITTKIQPDGSIEQIIVFQGDSTEITNANFALLHENDWKREWSKQDKDKFKLSLSKKFNSVDELNRSMNPADSTLQVVRINATLHRKFRWFFTRFEFEETVLNANPFVRLDYRNYLNDEEIRLIALTEEEKKTDPGYDSVKFKQTDKHFEEYLFRCIYEDFYRELISILDEDKTLSLTRQDLDQKKESIYHELIDSVKGDKPEDILKGLGKIVKSPDIETISAKYLNRFEKFTAKMEYYEAASDDNYQFAIGMPGLLLQTNSPKVEGSQTGWNLTYYNFFFHDYVMTAESRIVNPWAFILAGLIFLAALAGLISALRKKR